MEEVWAFWEVWICCRVRLSRVFGGWKIVSDVDCYVGAEIPPAGVPTGFDSAAMFDFIA